MRFKNGVAFRNTILSNCRLFWSAVDYVCFVFRDFIAFSLSNIKLTTVTAVIIGYIPDFSSSVVSSFGFLKLVFIYYYLFLFRLVCLD